MLGSSRPALAARRSYGAIGSGTFAFAVTDTVYAEPPAADKPAARQPPPPQVTPEITVLNKHEVEGILGRDVRSSADEDMGRIVDVLVDRRRPGAGRHHRFRRLPRRRQPQDRGRLECAAFSAARQAGRSGSPSISPAIRSRPRRNTREGKPVVILGALGKLESLPE